MSESETSLESAASAEDDKDECGLEPIYCELKNEGLNSVDGIVHVLKQAQVIDRTERSEKIVREMFECVPDKNDVQFEPFRAVVTKLATKLELLKIAWRLKKAERQLKKAEKEMNKALKNTSKGMSKTLQENKEMKYSYSRTTVKKR